MTRRRYLVAYDICDDHRLRQVCKTMEGHGDRLQYSVFVCDLNRTELLHLRATVEQQMQLTEDSVVIVDLGDTVDARFTFLGRSRRLPTVGPQIV